MRGGCPDQPIHTHHQHRCLCLHQSSDPATVNWNQDDDGIAVSALSLINCSAANVYRITSRITAADCDSASHNYDIPTASPRPGRYHSANSDCGVRLGRTPLDCQRSISTYHKGRITRNMNPRTRISGTGSSPGDFIGGVSLKRNIQGCPATKSIPLSPASEVAAAGFMLTPANVILAVTPPGITMRQPLAAESFVEMVGGVPLLTVSTWQLLES